MANRHEVNGADAPGPTPGAVEALIERFGGLRPMADKLGVPVSTVQGWKKRGAVPANRQSEIRAAMLRLNLGDPDADLDRVFRIEDAAPAAESAPVPAVAVPVAAVSVAAMPEAVSAPSISDPAPIESASPQSAEPVVEPPQAASPQAEPAPSQSPQAEPVRSLPAAVETPPPPEAPASPPAAASASASPVPAAPVPAEETVQIPDQTPHVGASRAADVDKQEAPLTDETPQTPVQSAEDRPQGSQGTGVAVAAAVLAVIGAAVSVTAPLWSHEYLQRSINVAGIEKRTAELEAAVGAGAGQGSALVQRVGGVEKTLATLESRIAKAPAVAGALAVRDLRAALASGAPFAFEAAIVRASGLLGPDETALLAALDAYADKGVPTAQVLNERFAWTASTAIGSSLSDMLPKVSLPTVSSEIPVRVWTWASGVAGGVAAAVGDAAAAGTEKIGGLAEALRLKDPAAPVDSTAAPAAPVAPAPVAEAPAPAPVPAAPETPAAETPAVETPVVAAPVAEPAGPSPAALFTMAGAHLREGDLAAAVDVVAQLEGKPAELAAEWLADARARLAADKASAAVAEKATKALQ